MNWITQLFRRRRMQKDLSAEIHEHLEQKVEELVEAGMTREEAMFEARRQFGSVTQIEERSRETWQWPSLESIVADIRYGLRMLRKHPGFTAVAVLTLAIGIGANTAIFSVVNTVLLRPLPYPHADRIVYLSEWSQDVPDMSIAMANFDDWEKMNKVFDGMVAYRGENLNLTGQGEPQRLAVREVTAGLFPTLGVEPILGRELTPEDDKPGAEPVILLSDSLWARGFGRDPSVLGRRLNLDGELYTVIGVLPSSRFHPSWRRYDAFTSLGRLENAIGGPQRRSEHPGIYAYGRMKPGTSVEQARADMVAVVAQLGKQYPKTNAGNSGVVMRLLDAVVEDVRPSLLVLMGAVGLVLLIACANVANLMTSRATERRREVALRCALGAGGGRLARQFLCESILLALIGGVLGLVVAYSTTKTLAQMAAAAVPRIQDVAMDWRVLAFTFAVSVLTGVVFGVFPALTAYRSDPNEVLKSSSATSTGLAHMNFRNVLAAAELAISLMLLVGAGLTLKSLYRIVQADAGFDPDGVLAASFNLPDSQYKTDEQKRLFVQQLVDKAAALPGVMAAGFKNPLLGGSQTGFVVEGCPKPEPGKAPSTEIARVTPGAMEAMGIRLLQGRFFNAGDNQQSMKVLVIDENMARQNWPGEDPIGKRMLVMIGPEPHGEIPWMTVVGVVRQVKNYGVDQPTRVEAYVPNAQFPGSGGNLVLRSQQDPEHLVSAVRRTLHSLDPNMPLFNVQTLRDVSEENVAPRKLSVLLLSLFSGIALVLAALGIYGVMAYVVVGRTREIGLRMALGARPGDVLGLVLGQGVRVAICGVLAGVVASLALTRLMRSLLFQVSATDPVTFAAVALLLSGVALVACYIPARAAMNLDPLVTLRYE
jgi:putative ABC transport system permease protein